MDSRDIAILAGVAGVWWYFTKNPSSAIAGGTTYPANTTANKSPSSSGGGSGFSVGGGGGGSGSGGGGGSTKTPISGTGSPLPSGSYINNQDPCDPSTPFYNPALCPDTPVTNVPVDTGDPCDKNSSAYDPNQCGTPSGGIVDSGDPCDSNSYAYDPNQCYGYYGPDYTGG